ncbi:hypothetical protein KAI32_01535 [Candidatus Pacearchaeota archaeon]|nr:hypothetical protein [Candidatus Pacearchaeota archaeon]
MIKKGWMGIGVSNTYVKILKSLDLSEFNFDNFLIIIADEINTKYNSRKKGQLSEDISNLSKKISLKGLSVQYWNYFSSKKKYRIFLDKYRDLFINDENFQKDVLRLVKRNRKMKEIKNSEGYVLEELASISYMAEKGFVKFGVKSKEEVFDNLAKKYPLVNNLVFEYF